MPIEICTAKQNDAIADIVKEKQDDYNKVVKSIKVKRAYYMEKISSIVLEKAAEQDLDEVYALCQHVAANTPSSGWSSDYPSCEILASDLSSQTLYKVMHAEKIISIMQIRPWALFLQGEEAEDITSWNPNTKNPCGLGRFCVSTDFQGQGLGRRVMQKTLEKAKEMGFDSARFHAEAANPVANHLYESMGFHKVGTINEYGITFNCYEMML